MTSDKPSSKPFILRCHPDARAASVSGLQVGLNSAAEGVLDLEYRLTGELSQMRIPSPLPPERVDGLWCHTCFEVFVGGADRRDYLEYNLAPSGQWQAYAFSDYRHDRQLLRAESPTVNCSRARPELSLRARIRLPEAVDARRLHLGLCAVLEDMQGGVSHWALRHSSGRPDFHHRSTFVATLGGCEFEPRG